MLRWMLLGLTLSLVACGGKGADGAADAKSDVDADPFALLPAAAIVLADLDARALFDSGSVGAQLASIADSLVPVGDDAGFRASRDVDRVVLAGYGTSGVDVAAVLSGRFDPDKLSAATKAKNGGTIVKGVYAGRATSTVGTVVFAPLTARTVVAGTGDGVRRVLERVQAGKLERALVPWMVETVQTQGAQVAVAADFVSQPVASAAIGAVKLPWLKGLRAARVIGNFKAPGMNVAATLTYGDAAQAETAAEGVRFVDGWLKVLGPLLGGVRLQNLQVSVDQADLRCKFAVDDQSLRTLLALAPRYLPALAGPQ
jgi:hypothetical protein